MRERREYVRSNGLVLINYKVPELRLEGKSSAFDVCGTGVRITVERELKLGTLVEFELYLPGSSQPILARAQVVWLKKCKDKAKTQLVPPKEYFYAGLKFISIDENSRARIINYVHLKLHQSKE